MSKRLESEELDTVNALKYGNSPSSVFKNRVKVLLNKAIEKDSISLAQYRLLFLISGNKIRDFFEVDERLQIAIPIVPHKNETLSQTKFRLLTHINAKYRKVMLDNIQTETTDHKVERDSNQRAKNEGGSIEVPKTMNGIMTKLLTHIGITQTTDTVNIQCNMYTSVIAGVILWTALPILIPTTKAIVMYPIKKLLKGTGIIKYWGEEGQFYDLLEDYNLEHIMPKMHRLGYRKVDDLLVHQYDIGGLMKSCN